MTVDARVNFRVGQTARHMNSGNCASQRQVHEVPGRGSKRAHLVGTVNKLL